jgi:hypothetical protein
MQKLFYVSGLSSFNPQKLHRVFDTKPEADNFKIGLQDTNTLMFQGKTKIECFNKLLGAFPELLKG